MPRAQYKAPESQHVLGRRRRWRRVLRSAGRHAGILHGEKSMRLCSRGLVPAVARDGGASRLRRVAPTPRTGGVMEAG
jgi:hypothetical protein